jgi:hypothetical protein
MKILQIRFYAKQENKTCFLRFEANKYSLHIRLYSLRTEDHGAPYLRDDPNLGAEVGHVEALHVVALELEAAGLQVVEALDQLDDGGLAAAGLSHESHALSRLINVKRRNDFTFAKITF